MKVPAYLIAALIAPLAPLSLADGMLDFSAGAEYSSGKYGGTTPTDIFYYPINISYRQPTRSYSLTVPYVRISGSSNVIGAMGNGFQVGGGMGGVRRTVAGLGDIVLTATQTLHGTPASDWELALTAQAKLGTASSQNGLGTGKNDYSAQLDFFGAFERSDVFGSLGWRRMGDPAGLDFSNPWFASLGTGYAFSDTLRIGLTYDFRQSVLTGTENFSEWQAFCNYALTPQATMQVYALKGTTSNSPDQGVGAMFRLSL